MTGMISPMPRGRDWLANRPHTRTSYPAAGRTRSPATRCSEHSTSTVMNTRVFMIRAAAASRYREIVGQKRGDAVARLAIPQSGNLAVQRHFHRLALANGARQTLRTANTWNSANLQVVKNKY